MLIKEFRVRDFRSIKDTDWQPLSPDNVTVLVGQNESGKSSILEALSHIGRSKKLKLADMRSDSGRPNVAIRAMVSSEDLDGFLDGLPDDFCKLAKAAFAEAKGDLTIEYVADSGVDADALNGRLVSPTVLPHMPEALRATLGEEEAAGRRRLDDAWSKFEEWVVEDVPLFTLYREESSSLPDSIFLDGAPLFANQPGGAGARNFISVSGLKVKELLDADDRRRSTLIRHANDRVNTELRKFWTQLLGKESRITIECEFGRRPPNDPEKPGAPYLSFWVSEGIERFYPSQRSRGTRWFVSVFLHLLAIEARKVDSIVMLDEPGSFLHATAQDDVRRLIERVAENCPVIYSTHNPSLVDFEKPYRILAIERAQGDEHANTQVLRALKLASASTETLTPILEKMGADIRHQTVIQRTGNVVLEEPSAHFYLRAFELLLRRNDGLAFIAASGVNNVPTLFSLLLAWRLKFSVLLDDDSQARDVRKRIVKDFFGGEDSNADQQLVRMRGADGIEDVFSRHDFLRVVLENEYEASEGQKNSALAKAKRINKAVTAYRFLLRVKSGEISRDALEAETVERFNGLLDRLRDGSS